MTRRNPLSAALTAVAIVLATFVVFVAPARALTNCTVSAADQAVDAEELQLLALVNQYRLANGRAPLAMDPDVTRAAASFARDMAGKNYVAPDHVDSIGRDIPTRLTQCDVAFTVWAENIAWGYDVAEEVFTAWRNSPGHNTNMLRQEVTLAGIGRAFDAASTFDWYWVLDLTAPAAGGATTTTTAPTTTTVAPTTTTTAAPATTTTAAPTATTTVAPTTTTTSASTTTTTVLSTATTASAPTLTASVATPPSAERCAALLPYRNQVSAQITAIEQALARSLSGAELQAHIARLEQIRAASNASINTALASAGCPSTAG